MLIQTLLFTCYLFMLLVLVPCWSQLKAFSWGIIAFSWGIIAFMWFFMNYVTFCQRVWITDISTIFLRFDWNFVRGLCVLTSQMCIEGHWFGVSQKVISENVKNSTPSAFPNLLKYCGYNVLMVVNQIFSGEKMTSCEGPNQGLLYKDFSYNILLDSS